MLTKEDASRAKKLFDEIESLQSQLTAFSKEEKFYISGYSYFKGFAPIASDIAKQIGYKYYNDEIFKIKQELADMGFSCEEKKEGKIVTNQDDLKYVLSENDFKQAMDPEPPYTVQLNDLNKKYEKVYGKWPKEEQENEEVKQHFLNGGAKSEE